MVRSLILTALVLLAGCVGERHELIRHRRDRELMAKQEAASKKTPEEHRWERRDLRERNRLDRELKESQAYYDQGRAQVGGVLGRVDEDPWRHYEQTRRATFHRSWSDADNRNPPPLVPDTDGPPSWLGPKLPPNLGGPVQPAEGGFEPAPDEGGDDEGAEDDWGDEGDDAPVDPPDDDDDDW